MRLVARGDMQLVARQRAVLDRCREHLPHVPETELADQFALLEEAGRVVHIGADRSRDGVELVERGALQTDRSGVETERLVVEMRDAPQKLA